MGEETSKPVAETVVTEEVVVVADVPPPPAPESEKKPEPDPDAAAEAENPKEKEKEEEEQKAKAAEEEVKEKITESASFKEETNVVGDLPESQKKALDELKNLIQEALKKREFYAPPPPSKEEEKKEEEKIEEKKEEEKKEEAKPETEEAAKPAEETEPCKEELKKPEPEPVVETTPPAPPAEAQAEVKAKAETEAVVEVEKVVEKATGVDDDGAVTVEAIKETIVEVSTKTEEAATPEVKAEPKTEGEEAKEEVKEEEVVPEEVFIYGIPLVGDEKSDVILLKFLRAREFRVKEAFNMIKNTVRWRKEFDIDAVLEEDLGSDLEKAVFMHGLEKEGHPVCYNVYGEFQNKEVYQATFADEEKRKKFLKWRIQFLEKSVRKLDYSPTGICTIVHVNDMKNFPGLFQRDLRQAINKALQLLQDNYPEFVAKQLCINVPWWYWIYHKMISPFLTQRTKSKFVFATPARSVDTLFKYIAPEHVPVQYGGLSREGEQEFSVADSVTEATVKPASKYTVEIPVSEACVLVWEARVVGWDVCYGAEFVPSSEGSYTVIVEKSRKIAPTYEPIVSTSFKVIEPGKVVLTIDNQTSKKKKLLHRSKTKPSTEVESLI